MKYSCAVFAWHLGQQMALNLHGAILCESNLTKIAVQAGTPAKFYYTLILSQSVGLKYLIADNQMFFFWYFVDVAVFRMCFSHYS